MRLLFIPVSAPRGFGEYARARAIALAVAARWPTAEIRFVLSREAPYAAECPFPTTLLPSSATFHTPEVITLIRSYRPDLVIFDNAGRRAQIRAAHCAGARVVYISSRRRQRARAFRLSVLRSLDEHWIAYPTFIAGPLTVVERLKLRLAGRTRVRYLDTILPPPDVALEDRLLRDLAMSREGYILVVPGGGTPHPGAEDAPGIIARAARQLAERGLAAVLVGVAPGADALPQLRAFPRLPLGELSALMRAARLVVANGGDTLLQVLACGRPCLACPIAPDQGRRIELCRGLGLIEAAALDSLEVASRAASLFDDHERRQRLMERIQGHPVHDALPEVVEAISLLSGRPQSGGAP